MAGTKYKPVHICTLEDLQDMLTRGLTLEDACREVAEEHALCRVYDAQTVRFGPYRYFCMPLDSEGQPTGTQPTT